MVHGGSRWVMVVHCGSWWFTVDHCDQAMYPDFVRYGLSYRPWEAKHSALRPHHRLAIFLFPNSLALTVPNAFFVANDHLFTRRIDLLTFTESILGGSAFPLATSRTSCFLQTLSPPSSPSHSFHFPRHCALSRWIIPPCSLLQLPQDERTHQTCAHHRPSIHCRQLHHSDDGATVQGMIPVPKPTQYSCG